MVRVMSTDPTAHTTGVLVRLARMAKGWTQAELAERAHLGTRAVENIEGGRAVSERVLTQVAAALGVATSDLTGEKLERGA